MPIPMIISNHRFGLGHADFDGIHAMLYDLNVPWPVLDYVTKPSAIQLVNFKNTVATLYSLGYTHLTINFKVSEVVRLPINQPDSANPIPIEQLRKELCTESFPGLKLFTRFTLIVSDPAKCQCFGKFQHKFDILAIQPILEKALQVCSTNLDIDLVSFNFSNKLPFFLKHKTVGSAIEKGIKFEICYSAVISGHESRDQVMVAAMAKKNFFNGALQLIRASRSRGLVVLSGASEALQARGSFDVLALLQSIGLDKHRAKACMEMTPERALANGRMRSMLFKQAVVVDPKSNALKRQSETPIGALLKRSKQSS